MVAVLRPSSAQQFPLLRLLIVVAGMGLGSVTILRKNLPKNSTRNASASISTSTSTSLSSYIQAIADYTQGYVVSDWKYQPWQCRERRKQMRAAGADPNAVSLQARYVDGVEDAPPFYMSLCDEEYDPLRWKIMVDGFYYETHVTRAFVSILGDEQFQNSDKDVRVMDVGSNQGWFSLISATMGYPVDAFDANPVNSLRICESNHVNGWDSDGYRSTVPGTKSVVNVYNFGVSDVSDVTVPFVVPKHNPGEASFRVGVDAPHDEDKFYYSNMTLLTLDDFAAERGWLDAGSDTVIALLKVDVETLEDKVFRGARALLESGIVKNVMMELTASDQKSVARSRPVAEYFAREAGYRLRAYGYNYGPDQDGKDVTGDEAVALIDRECFNVEMHCNLWWASPASE